MIEIKVTVENIKSSAFRMVDEATLSVAWRPEGAGEGDWRWLILSYPVYSGNSLSFRINDDGARIGDAA